MEDTLTEAVDKIIEFHQIAPTVMASRRLLEACGANPLTNDCKVHPLQGFNLGCGQVPS